MDFKDLILKNRSYRRFYEDESFPTEILLELVDYARLSPSARNDQPLKYIISNEQKISQKIFETVKWAGYLKDWDGPVVGERPSAYIVVLLDSSISKTVDCDHGIVSQSILLGAISHGYGGCILGSFNRDQLMSSLDIDDKYIIKLVIALGKPKEDVVIESIKDDDVKYWRDEKLVHHLPKRELNDLVL